MTTTLYGTTLWDAYLIGTGMSLGQTSSPSSREIDLDYFERLTAVLADYRAQGLSEINQAALKEMEAQIKLLDVQTSYVTETRESQGRDMRAALAARQRYLSGVGNNITKLGTVSSPQRARIVEPAVVKAQAGDQTGAWRTAIEGIQEVGPLGAVPDPALVGIFGSLVTQLDGIEWDPNTGTVTATGTVDFGDAAFAELQRIGQRASTAHISQLQARQSLEDLSGRLGGLSSSLMGGGEITQEELDAIDAEAKEIFTRSNEAYGLLDRETIASRVDEFTQDDKVYTEYDALWNQLRDDLFPKEAEASRRAVIMADPYFRQWAEENGFRRIGRTVDGQYVPGAADDRALKRYMLQVLRGGVDGRGKMSPIGRPRMTGQIARVVVPVNPRDAETFRNANGRYFVDGEGNYIDPENIRRLNREVAGPTLVSIAGMDPRNPDLRIIVGSDISGGPLFAMNAANGEVVEVPAGQRTLYRQAVQEEADAAEGGLMDIGSPLIFTNEEGSATRYAQAYDLRNAIEDSDTGRATISNLGDIGQKFHQDVNDEMRANLPEFDEVDTWDPDQSRVMYGNLYALNAGDRANLAATGAQGDSARYIAGPNGPELVPDGAQIEIVGNRPASAFFDIIVPDFFYVRARRGAQAAEEVEAEEELTEGERVPQGRSDTTIVDRTPVYNTALERLGLAMGVGAGLDRPIRWWQRSRREQEAADLQATELEDLTGARRETEESRQEVQQEIVAAANSVAEIQAALDALSEGEDRTSLETDLTAAQATLNTLIAQQESLTGQEAALDEQVQAARTAGDKPTRKERIAEDEIGEFVAVTPSEESQSIPESVLGLDSDLPTDPVLPSEMAEQREADVWPSLDPEKREEGHQPLEVVDDPPVRERFDDPKAGWSPTTGMREGKGALPTPTVGVGVGSAAIEDEDAEDVPEMFERWKGLLPTLRESRLGRLQARATELQGTQAAADADAPVDEAGEPIDPVHQYREAQQAEKELARIERQKQRLKDRPEQSVFARALQLRRERQAENAEGGE
jgi:hypothetical protein